MPRFPQVLHLLLETAKQREGDPQSGSLRCASGNLRCARKAGVRANSPAAQTARGPDPAFPTQHRPSQDGLGEKTKDKSHTDISLPPPLGEGWGGGCPRTRTRIRTRTPPPSVCAEERRSGRIRARDCLSEVQRSEFERDPGWTEHRRLPVAQRRDPDCGSPFVWSLYFGEAK